MSFLKMEASLRKLRMNIGTTVSLAMKSMSTEAACPLAPSTMYSLSAAVGRFLNAFAAEGLLLRKVMLGSSLARVACFVSMERMTGEMMSFA